VILEKLFTKDFAVSDNLETLQTEGSWILKLVDFKYTNFNFSKMVNVANCKTPIGSEWNIDYGQEFQYYHENNGQTESRLDDNRGLL
jgi:hypothetical protein